MGVTLRPEQQLALGYARRRGSNAPVKDIVGRVRGTYAHFEALVAELAADLAGRRTAASSWSIHEVVTHLVLSDRPAVFQLSELLQGRDVAEPIPAHLQSPNPLAVSWPELLRDFSRVHREIEALLDSASDEALGDATAPVHMVVKCATPDGGSEAVEWIERFDWKAFAVLIHAHNREHIAQVQRILAAASSGGG